jgi:hypothetical protein
MFREVLHIRVFLLLVPVAVLALAVSIAELSLRDKRFAWGLGGLLFLSNAYSSAEGALDPPVSSPFLAAFERLSQLQGKSKTILADRPGDSLALCWHLVDPGSTASSHKAKQCTTEDGTTVYHRPQFLRAAPGETVVVLARKKFKFRIPRGYKVIKRKGVLRLEVIKMKRVTSASRARRLPI